MVGLTLTLQGLTPSFITLDLIDFENLNAKTGQNVQSQCQNGKKIGQDSRRIDLYSSRCMHDPSFIALALIVSEKDLITKNNKNLENQGKYVCMTQVSWLYSLYSF